MHEGIHAFRPSNSGGFGTDRLKPGIQTTELQPSIRAFLAFMRTRCRGRLGNLNPLVKVPLLGYPLAKPCPLEARRLNPNPSIP